MNGLVPEYFGTVVPVVLKPQEIHTPYGRWFLYPEGIDKRAFRPHQRVSRFWAELQPIKLFSLPLHETHILDNIATIETVRVVSNDGVISLGYMCPWCGVIESFHAWQNFWQQRCGWCNAASRKVGGILP
mgnify:FL=1